MKEKLLLILVLLSTSVLNVFSQEPCTKFFFSGYRVHIIPSKTYALVSLYNVKATQEMVDGVMRISIYDQTGSVPKDEIYLFTDRVDYLYLHNSDLVSDKTLNCDSLTVMTASSTGTLTVKANSLYINAGACTNFTLKGKTKFLNCEVGAASHVSSKELLTEEADINVMGYSSLSVMAMKVKNKKIENSSFKNILE